MTNEQQQYLDEKQVVEETIKQPGKELHTLLEMETLTEATWDNIDIGTLSSYLEQCGKAEYTTPSWQEHRDKIRKYLSKGLKLLSHDGDGAYLTRAGAILLCRALEIPEGLFRGVIIYDERESRGVPPKFTPPPPVYQTVSTVKSYLVDMLETMCAESGYASYPYVPYPEEAIVEALTNFFIHRDYSSDQKGQIEITDDYIQFKNPGCSLVEDDIIKRTLESRKSLHAQDSYSSCLRNPHLVSALRYAKIGQEQGRGLIRIKEALVANHSYKSDGTLGIDFSSQPNSFTLTIYKKRISPEEEKIQNLTNEKRQLESELELAQSQLDSAKAEMQELEQTSRKLEQELERTKEQQNELQRELGEIQRILQQEKTDVKLKFDEIEYEQEGLKKELDDANTEINRLQRKLDSASAEMQRTQQEKTNVEHKLAELEKTLENKTQELESKQHELGKIARDKEQIEYERKGLKKELGDANTEIHRLQQQETDSRNSVNELEGELDRIKKGRDGFQKQAKRVQVFALVLLLFSLLSGAIGLNSIFEKHTTASPLQMELGVLDDAAPHCNSDDETWSVTLYALSEGGKLPLTYYWNSQQVTRTLSQGDKVMFPLEQRNGASIGGTAFVVSADGQSAAREIAISAPSCPE